MQTDKPTTTASATPDKVRTYIDNEREPGLRNYIETGRTIPADGTVAVATNPTARTFMAQVERNEAWIKLEEVQHHADKLAEALRDCMADLDHYVSTHGPGPDRRRDAAKQALAAYQGFAANESEMQQ